MTDSTNPRILADNIRHLSEESGSQASDISALQTMVTALRSYSEEEADTGKKWIDGSPIFQKIFTVDAFPNNTTINVSHNVSNLGTVIELRGMAVDSDGSGLPIEFRNLLYLRYSPTQISIASTTDYSAFSGYIIFEYTKSASPSPNLSPAPDDTRSIEPEVREEEPEAEPIEEPVKKTTRKKTTTE